MCTSKQNHSNKYTRTAPASLPVPCHRNLQQKMYFPTKAELRGPIPLKTSVSHKKKQWKFLKSLALELGIWAGCVSGMEQLAWKLSQNQLQQCSQARTPPSQQPYAFPLWLQSCSKNQAFIPQRREGKKKKNPRLQPIQVWTSLFYSWKLHSFTVQLYHRQKHAKPLLWLN